MAIHKGACCPSQYEHTFDINNVCVMCGKSRIDTETGRTANPHFQKVSQDKEIQLTTQQIIAMECHAINNLLQDKNAKYGNAYLEPSTVFCKLSTEDRINARIDEKLARIKAGGGGEDAELDLIGCLIMKRVARKAGKK